MPPTSNNPQPFDVFLPSVSVTPNSNLNENFVCGFQFSFSESNSSNPGATASGIWAILNGMWLLQNYNNDPIGDPLYNLIEKPVFDQYFFPVITGAGKLNFIIRGNLGISRLISNLNILHRNIAGYISLVDTTNNPYILAADITPAVLQAYQDYYNRFTNYNFIGSYIDFASTRNPKTDEIPGDLRGNGITQFFVLRDQDLSKWQVSRVGAELQILIDYLAYGGTAVLSTDWNALTSFNTAATIPGQIVAAVAASAGVDIEQDGNQAYATAAAYTGPLEAVVSIDNGGLIERRQTVAGFGTTGANRVAYACQEYTFANPGVSYGLIYGLTGSELINDHASPNGRGSFVTALLFSQRYLHIPIIHCGLSGTDITIAQDSINANTDYTDIFRYPGLNGLTGERPIGFAKTAGLTSYILTEDNYTGLNRLFCAFGKNVKTYFTQDFGDPKNNTLIVKVPTVGDVAGIIAFNKSSGTPGVFGAPIGPINGAVLNGEIQPTIPFNSSTEPAKRLLSQRINFFDFDQFRDPPTYFLGYELVGATANTRTPTDRFSVMNMVRNLKAEVESYGQTEIIPSESVNNSDLWREITTYITDRIIVPKYEKYLQPGWSVVCNGSNNSSATSVVNVRIEITPKVVTYDYTPSTTQTAQSFILTFTIT